MSSLVLELQRDALDQSVRVSDLLRKAVVVAAKLGINDFRQWAEAELRGYMGIRDVPSYRKVNGALKARNPYRGWIPVILEDSTMQRKLESRNAGQSVGELEELLSSGGKKQTLQMTLPHDWLMKVFSNTTEFRLGMVPTLLVDNASLRGILDSVRNEVLQWSLRLEAQGILGEGMTFSATEKEKALHITYNIGSFSGVLGDVTGSTVQIGDYSSIHASLKDAGVPAEGRHEIEEVLDDIKSTTVAKREGAVTRGMQWLAKYGPIIGTLSDTIRGWIDLARGA